MSSQDGSNAERAEAVDPAAVSPAQQDAEDSLEDEGARESDVDPDENGSLHSEDFFEEGEEPLAADHIPDVVIRVRDSSGEELEIVLKPEWYATAAGARDLTLAALTDLVRGEVNRNRAAEGVAALAKSLSSR